MGNQTDTMAVNMGNQTDTAEGNQTDTAHEFFKFIVMAEEQMEGARPDFSFMHAWSRYEENAGATDLEGRLRVMRVFLEEEFKDTNLGQIFRDRVLTPHHKIEATSCWREAARNEEEDSAQAEAALAAAAEAAAIALETAEAAQAAEVAPPHSEPVPQLPISAGDSAGLVYILDVISGEEVTKVPIVPQSLADTMDQVKRGAREMLNLEHPAEEPQAKRRRLDLRGGAPGTCFMCEETEPVKEIRAFQCFDSKGQVKRHEDMQSCKDCFKKYVRHLLDGGGQGQQYRKMDCFGDDHNHWTLNFPCMSCNAKTMATWNEMH